MEERMIDDDFGKNEDFSVEIPDGAEENYNEDEVGLTPTQLAALEEERKRQQKEAEEARDKRIAQGKLALSGGYFEEATEHFAAALSYDPESKEAGDGWIFAKTHGFTRDELYSDPEFADDFSRLNGESKAVLREKVGERLKEELTQTEAELAPLEAQFSAAQAERREAFTQNTRFYALRTAICFAAIVLCVIGVLISSYFIPRTQSVAPVVLTICFGVFALIAAVVTVFIARAYVSAKRLQEENEELSSTEDGARVEELQMLKYCLDTLLYEGADEE